MFLCDLGGDKTFRWLGRSIQVRLHISSASLSLYLPGCHLAITSEGWFRRQSKFSTLGQCSSRALVDMKGSKGKHKHRVFPDLRRWQLASVRSAATLAMLTHTSQFKC